MKTFRVVSHALVLISLSVFVSACGGSGGSNNGNGGGGNGGDNGKKDTGCRDARCATPATKVVFTQNPWCMNGTAQTGQNYQTRFVANADGKFVINQYLLNADGSRGQEVAQPTTGTWTLNGDKLSVVTGGKTMDLTVKIKGAQESKTGANQIDIISEASTETFDPCN